MERGEFKCYRCEHVWAAVERPKACPRCWASAEHVFPVLPVITYLPDGAPIAFWQRVLPSA